MTKTNEKWERFKRELLAWKEAHAEEYNAFAKKMESSDIGLMELADVLKHETPALAKAWSEQWEGDSTEDYERMNEIVRKSETLSSWVNGTNAANRCQPEDNLGKMLLCWIVYGQMFECIVRYYERIKSSPEVGFVHRYLWIPFLIRQAINASIKSGYRTKQDWNRYFKLSKAYKEDAVVGETVWEELRQQLTDEEKVILEESKKALETEVEVMNPSLKSGRKKSKAMPLSNYIDSPDKEAVLETVRRFIAENNTGFGLAIPYFALTKLGLLRNIEDDKEYSIALNLQFSDSMPELKSESSCRQALGNLKKPQYIMKKGKQIEAPLVEDDKHRILLERLMDELNTTLHSL
ncbi:MAG: hypothetical protein KHX42_07605 [Prevotella sp.]|nr:hypothetical protein [Prevotella sp.]